MLGERAVKQLLSSSNIGSYMIKVLPVVDPAKVMICLRVEGSGEPPIEIKLTKGSEYSLDHILNVIMAAKEKEVKHGEDKEDTKKEAHKAEEQGEAEAKACEEAEGLCDPS